MFTLKIWQTLIDPFKALVVALEFVGLARTHTSSLLQPTKLSLIRPTNKPIIPISYPEKVSHSQITRLRKFRVAGMAAKCCSVSNKRIGQTTYAWFMALNRARMSPCSARWQVAQK